LARVRFVKVDGESVHVFNSAIYIFESSSGATLELEMIVSEVAVKKYRNEENLIIEMELEDGRVINSIMHLKVLPGKLPQLNLFVELDKVDEYGEFDIVSENDSYFPNIEEGITLEEIRKVEMPNEKVTLKLNLPIEQVEWLHEQKSRELNEIFRELIYYYWEKNLQDDS
jgi:hypothetical protein